MKSFIHSKAVLKRKGEKMKIDCSLVFYFFVTFKIRAKHFSKRWQYSFFKLVIFKTNVSTKMLTLLYTKL